MKIYFTNAGLRKGAIKRVAEIALSKLSQPSKQLEMSLSVVTPAEIQRLNNEYRQVDSATDVLSFPTTDLHKAVIDMSEVAPASVNPATGRLNLGDVIICAEKAREQAAEYGHSVKREMCFLALHGLLHLLGYDHVEQEDEEEMTSLQAEILQQAGITR